MRLFAILSATMVMLAGPAIATAADADPGSRSVIPSAGCGAAEVEPGWSKGHLTHGGDERIWRAWVPESHDGLTPIPLWVHLHPYMDLTAGGAVLILDHAADHGFAILAPQAPGWARYWIATPSLVDPEVAFIRALLDEFGETHCIDLARVYAEGFSMGAAGVSALSCILDDRIAAVAASGGVRDFGDACDPARPVPLLAIHGRNDQAEPFDGDPSVPQRVAAFALRNGCEGDPMVTPIAEGTERWNWACPAGSEVELVVHDEDHTQLLARTDVDLTELTWEFFEQHPMPE